MSYKNWLYTHKIEKQSPGFDSVPSTQGVNPDSAWLEMPEKSFAVGIEEIERDLKFPDAISLTVEVETEAMDVSQLTAQATVDGEDYTASKMNDTGAFDQASKILWGAEGPIGSVSLLFKETLSYQYQNRESFLALRDWSFNFEAGEEVYKKRFSTPQHNITFSRDQDDGSSDWVMGVLEHNFQAEESTPYMAFGGYWNPKAPLDQCEPLYLSIDTNEENVSTSLFLFRHKEWLERDVFPPEEGETEDMRIVFLGCDQPMTNLGQDVRSGKISVEMTSAQSGETKVYKSRSLSWEDPEKKTAELTLYALTETE